MIVVKQPAVSHYSRKVGYHGCNGLGWHKLKLLIYNTSWHKKQESNIRCTKLGILHDGHEFAATLEDEGENVGNHLYYFNFLR